MPMTPAQRKRIPAKQFVFPRERKYPINTKKNAQSALSLAALHGAQMGGSKGKALIDKVYRAVIKKYPNLAESDSKTMKAYLRRNGRKNPGHAHLSYSDMNSDQRELYESLMLIAANDPVAYAARKPSQAVDAAFKEYQRSSRRSLQEDFLSIRRQLVRDLQGRYRRNGRKNPGHADDKPYPIYFVFPYAEDRDEFVRRLNVNRVARWGSTSIMKLGPERDPLLSKDGFYAAFFIPKTDRDEYLAVKLYREYGPMSNYNFHPMYQELYLLGRRLTFNAINRIETANEKRAKKAKRKNPGHARKNPSLSHSMLKTHDVQGHKVDTYLSSRSGQKYSAFIVSEDFELPGKYSTRSGAVAAARAYLKRASRSQALAASNRFHTYYENPGHGKSLTKAAARDYRKMKGFVVKPQGWDELFDISGSSQQPNINRQLQMQILNYRYTKAGFDKPAGFVYVPKTHAEVIDAVYQAGQEPMNAKDALLSAAAADNFADMALESMRGRKNPGKSNHTMAMVRRWIAQYEKSAHQTQLKMLRKLEDGDAKFKKAVYAEFAKGYRKNSGHARHNPITISDSDVLAHQAWHQMKYLDQIKELARQGGISRQEEKALIKQYSQLVGELDRADPEKYNVRESLHAYRRMKDRKAARKNPGHAGFKDPFHRRDIGGVIVYSADVPVKGGEYAADIMKRKGKGYVYRFSVVFYPKGESTGTIVAQGTENTLAKAKAVVMRSSWARDAMGTDRRRNPGHARKNPKRKPSKAVSDRAKLVKQAFALREKTGSRIKPQTIMKDPAGCIRRMKGKR